MHHPKKVLNNFNDSWLWISSEFHDFGAHSFTDEVENVPQLASINKLNNEVRVVTLVHVCAYMCVCMCMCCLLWMSFIQ